MLEPETNLVQKPSDYNDGCTSNVSSMKET
jgi:hypothetical protein